MEKFEAAQNLAAFLVEQTGTVFGTWKGRMPAKQQRALFGRFVGKGWIVISGERETIDHTVSRCFGLDYETTFSATWRDL